MSADTTTPPRGGSFEVRARSSTRPSRAFARAFASYFPRHPYRSRARSRARRVVARRRDGWRDDEGAAVAPGRARVGAGGGRDARATRRTADANAWIFTARRDARGEDGARRERGRRTRETRTRRERNDRERASGISAGGGP